MKATLAPYSKMIATLLAFILYAVAQTFGLDLGEIGADLDGDLVVQGLMSVAMVYFSPKNQSGD